MSLVSFSCLRSGYNNLESNSIWRYNGTFNIVPTLPFFGVGHKILANSIGGRAVSARVFNFTGLFQLTFYEVISEGVLKQPGNVKCVH